MLVYSFFFNSKILRIRIIYRALLDEAIQNKKEIAFISMKSDTFIKNDEEFKNFRMFKFDTTAFNNISDSLNKNFNEESNKLVQFIRTYQK